MKSLSIIIVNWNTGHQLVDAISSIKQYHCDIVSSVIIVDNASSDDSLERVVILASLPFQFQIIRNVENRGFAAACNQGAALASTNYLLFLNPDTRLFESSLSVPLDLMDDENNTIIGICGIQLVDEFGRVSRSCARFPSLGIFIAQVFGISKLPGFRFLSTHRLEWNHFKTCNVDHVIGAFYLIRRSLFESLGGFDERFFVYLEDLDLSFRAHQAGWKSIYLANAQAFHAGGGTSYQVKAHRLFYSLRSRLLYGFKHFSLINAWVLLLITLGLEPFTRVIFALAKRDLLNVQHTVKGYFLLFMNLPAILRVALK